MGTKAADQPQEDQPIRKTTDLTDPYEGSAPEQETDQQRQQRESREAGGSETVAQRNAREAREQKSQESQQNPEG